VFAHGRASRNRARTSASDIASTVQAALGGGSLKRSYRRRTRGSCAARSPRPHRGPRHRDGREQHIADLLLGVVRVGVTLELPDLLSQGLDRRGRRAPLEPPAGGPALHLGGARERGQGLGDVVLERLSGALLLGLDPLPVHEDLVRAGDLDLPEHVRVPPDQLLHDPARDVVHVPRAFVGRHLRVEDDLQQDVAELLAQAIAVVRVDRVEHLVGLLEEVAREARVVLLEVPGTPARAAEPRHHPHEIQQSLAELGGRDRSLGDVREEVVVAGGHGPVVTGAVSPAGSSAVLRIGTTSRESMS
jgi:hypothetical protein